MKILFICEYYPSTTLIDIRGGVEARSYFIGSLLAQKHSVNVIASREMGKPKEQILGNVRVHRVGIITNYTRTGNIIPRILFQITAIRKGLELEFDLVEGSGFFSWVPTLILAKLRHKNSVALVADTINDYTKEINMFAQKIMLHIEQFLLKKNWDAIVTISQTVKSKLEAFGIPKQNIRVIHCGVPIGFIKTVRGHTRKEPTICCISRLVPYKKIDILIAAIQLLKTKYKHIRADIIGSGEDLSKLKAQVRQYKLTKNIYFHEYIFSYKEVLAILKQAHIFVLPSVAEGFGIATIEALTAQIPAVVTDLSIHHEITKNKGVVFFKPNNSSDLASKVEELITNKKLYNRLKQECNQIVKQYDWKVIAKKTERLYENLRTH